ncbi:cupin-like domain-containing protein [Thermomonas carbonis]|uniref:Cupin-like domain-containing protein n=1 Tax=Thermomonas carbonis TaxID=1463158 RepID=A0A7G9SSL4_9GAMM|nr:cupin-like domain-containing protein [Thermomonas carbonis]GHC02766.1 cupin [Thermomonas carbonis]
MLAGAEPIPERRGDSPDALSDAVLGADRPVVLRGVAAHWPMVSAARGSMEEAVACLRRHARADAPPVVATTGAPEIGGRVFYNETFDGFNFRQENVPLGVVLDTLLKYAAHAAPPMIYVASTSIDTWLPGLRTHNDLDLGGRDALASIWIGNRTRIAAHQDVPNNIACVVAGRRRVTLFPPSQLQNLYIGPLDFNPAGQAISLVDFAAPDLDRFPRFAEAMRHAQVAELEPGDAVFIPSLWWHHMEGLDAFNVLVNYWWRDAPGWMDTPMNVLMYALMTLRDLPAHERAEWQEVFRHYVFEADADTAAHIPEPARRVLSPLDEHRARDLRARLLKRINR